MKHKLCKGCLTELPISFFAPCKNVKDGYENKCRDCRRKKRQSNHKLICRQCGIEFSSSKKSAKFCSRNCQDIAHRSRGLVSCSWCGMEFEDVLSRTKTTRYCSKDCMKTAYSIKLSGKNNPNYKKIKSNCTGCGKVIQVQPYRLNNHKYHFCSHACYVSNIGKFKIGNLNSNYNRIKCKCEECGKETNRTPSSLNGISKVYCSKTCYNAALSKLRKESTVERKTVECAHCSKELKRTLAYINARKHVFCSMKCKDKHQSYYYVGDNNPNFDKNIPWIDRIRGRNYNEYWVWRKQVYDRDNYTCQCCGDNKGGNLVAHHLYNYSEYKELRTDINNGVTLCVKCHKTFHDIYGYTKNTKEQFEEYTEKLKETV